MNNYSKTHVEMVNLMLFQRELIDRLKLAFEESSTICFQDYNILYEMYGKLIEVYPSMSARFKENTDLETVITQQHKVLAEMAAKVEQKYRKLAHQGENGLAATKLKEKSKSSTNHVINIDITTTASSAPSEGSKVLGLLQKQKDMVSQDIQEERISHSLLTAELAETTHILKEATMQIREKVLEQNIQLDSLENYAGSNMASLEEQRKMVSRSFTSSHTLIFWFQTLVK